MIDAVSALLRTASAEAIMPRYKGLSVSEVLEKTPGEIVTIADRHAEDIITRGLLAIRPGTRVIGEEACAADGALLEKISDDAVWLVDPLDGTANFAAGRGPFAVMVALVLKGEVAASWMFEPLSDRFFVAESGGGAFINGARNRTAQDSPGMPCLRGVVATRFMPPDLQNAVRSRVPRIREALPPAHCAGTEYPEVANGEKHFALYWRALPWDHAPGSLFLKESGGYVGRPDGSAYQVRLSMPGLLVARNKSIWRDATSALLE
jgi:fructose-1,6-bisphosphatase/inositol monophosphatase family enzyme